MTQDSINRILAIQAYIAVVDSGSFTEAARRLGVSQPSVSRLINQLESSLDARLLQRTTRKVSPTEIGQIYYDKAREIERTIVEANASVTQFHEKPAGLLRVNMPHTWLEHKVTPHLKAFTERYPDIQLELQCDDGFADMINRQIDVVIRIGQLADSSFIAIPFKKVTLILCASPAYIEQKGAPKTISDLYNHPFIAYRQFHTLLFEEKGKSTELKLNSKISTHSVDTMIQTCQQGLGLSLLPDLLIKNHLSQKHLIPLFETHKISLKGLAVKEAFAMVPSREFMPPKTRVFLDFFKEQFWFFEVSLLFNTAQQSNEMLSASSIKGKPMKFRYSILYVEDVAQTLSFYEKAFGLERVFLHEAGDYGELATGDTKLAFSSLELMKNLGKSPIKANINSPTFEIAFETDEVASAVDKAVKQGAQLVQDVREEPWGQTTAYVSDINGFLIEICSPIKAQS